ncbi:MAG: diguanylate cyclase, partial [Pseudomonadales bacterium]
MMRIKPATRLSLGLMMLTICILFASDMLGLMPNATTSKLEARKKLCEALAVQFSSAVNSGALTSINETIKAVVARNEDVQSAALRLTDGAVVSRAGDHDRLWRGNDADKSSADNVVVPIFKSGQPWASVEIHFAPLNKSGIFALANQSFAGLIAFVALLGFVGYLLFMKKALRELDPSGVIPARVKAAFDALAEGVLILDEHGQIVLANAVFLEKAQRSLDYLLGREASTLNWSWPGSDKKPGLEHMPWNRVFEDGKSHTGVRLTLGENTKRQCIFMVNSAPILDDSGNSRGVLSTFDDVTELERKNTSLQQMLFELEKTQKKVESQNEKLQVLATRDPLTNCLNRRAMNEEFEPLFQSAKKSGTELSCLMVDIDHFKAVNDTFGHNIGDKIIKTVAAILKSNTRDVDLVGRYGGEEFCVILPNIQIEMATGIADRIRREIEAGGEARFGPLQSLTASFGVSSVVFGAEDTELLISEADKALYYAKSSGRNRVVSWNKTLEQEQEEGTAQDGYLDDLLIGQEASNDENVNDQAEHFKVHISAPEDSAASELEQATDITALADMPEKALFCDRINQALSRTHRGSGVAAVLSLGLDIFRKINYTLGPEAGNRLLLETAARLNHTLRESDSIALIAAEQTSPTILQLNGDEFGVLLTDV